MRRGIASTATANASRMNCGRQTLRHRAKMNEARDGDGEAPAARAKVQHAEVLEGRVLRYGVLVAEDAVIRCHQQYGGFDAAVEKSGGDASGHGALGDAGLER